MLPASVALRAYSPFSVWNLKIDDPRTHPKIRLRNVHKRFGEKIVLDGIDLDIMPGTSMVVIGGSGSGKSVLLKCILGLIEPDAGTIEIDGTNILTLPRREQETPRSRIGMLFQNGALFDSLPVWENVVFGLLAQRRIARADGATARPSSSPRSASRPASARCIRRNSRAACRSAWHWPAPSPPGPTSCSSTNRPPGSIRSWAR